MDYPEAVFTEIQHSIPANLRERLLAILQQHVGKENRISRKALVEKSCGVKLAVSELANSTFDRQVRIVLDELQDTHPILSSSGAGGYYYAGSAEEIARYAAELDSRAHKLLQKSRRLLRQARQFRAELQLSFPV